MRPFELLILAAATVPATDHATAQSRRRPTESRPATPVQVGPTAAHWRSELIFRAPVRLSGCAIGDVDPTRPGAEVVAVGGDGSVFVVARTETGWVGELAFQAGGELVQVAIGEVLPDQPGLEIIAVGKEKGAERDPGAGATWLVSRSEKAWAGKLIATSAKLTHGPCIANGEVFVTGYDQRLVRLTPESAGSTWREEKLVDLPGAGKNLIRMNESFIVACTDGSVVRVSRGSPDGWKSEVIDRREKGRGRLGTDGTRIVVSDDDGVFSVLEGGKRTELLRGSLRQRGAVLADLVPDRPGLEFATAGYDRLVRVFFAKDGGFETVAPYMDPERFHHLAAGNLDGDAAIEIVGCSFAGSVVLVEYVAAGS